MGEGPGARPGEGYHRPGAVSKRRVSERAGLDMPNERVGDDGGPADRAAEVGGDIGQARDDDIELELEDEVQAVDDDDGLLDLELELEEEE